MIPIESGPPMIVGLIGKKRSGKDTLAGHLIERHGFARYAFADRLRAYMLALDPIINYAPDGWPVRVSDLVNPKKTGKPEGLKRGSWERAKDEPEIRRLLQASGDGLRTHGLADVWLRPLLAEVDREIRPVVITDVRYRNEAEAIQERGGFLVRVTRPGQDEADQHPSEIDLDDWRVDITLQNDGDLARLSAQADALVPHLDLLRYARVWG